MSGPDASNSCLPATSPVILSVPPVPSCIRGERCPLTTNNPKDNNGTSLIYASNKFVVSRHDILDSDDSNNNNNNNNNKVALVYRGHTQSPVTAIGMANSGAYCCSGDATGGIKIWAYDQVGQHLCRYQAATMLSGPIRDVAWDGENKRIGIVGERAGNDAGGACCKAILWDTGNSVGQLGLHLKGRAASVAVKPQRPFRIVTAGKDDSKLLFHKGPPFSKVPVEKNKGVPMETAHSKGAVHCVRYNSTGTLVCSVGTDRSICIYDGKTLELKCKLEQIHTATVYCCAWSSDNTSILTASGDGTCKLFAVNDDEASGTTTLKEVKQWHVAQHQVGSATKFEKVPAGGVQLACTFLQNDTPVSVGYNGQISILSKPCSENNGNSNNDNVCKVITGHYAPIADLTIDETSRVFYTGDTDGILCQWDLDTCQPIQRLTGGDSDNNKDLMYVTHSGAISGVSVVPKNKTLYSVGWDDKLYVTVNGGVVQSSSPVSLGAQPVAIAIGKEIAVVVTVKGLLLVKDGKLMGSMISIPYEAQCVAVSADDKTAYVGGKDCKIYVYDINTAKATLSQTHCMDTAHLKPVHALSISNDGTKLASADERDVCVWDVTAKYKAVVARGKWCFHVQRITSLSWSPDDRILASGGADDSIYLWSWQSKMKRIHYPFAHRGGVVRVAFVKQNSKDDADGALKLLSVGVDSVVNLWDVTKDVKAKFG